MLTVLVYSPGLTVSEAAKLCSYMHFREPKQLKEKSLLHKANLEKSIDFMDVLEDDIPKGKFDYSFGGSLKQMYNRYIIIVFIYNKLA